MPHSHEIPEELKNFIISHFDSVGTIEVLLLLKNRPEGLWTVESVSQELRSNVSLIERQLQFLSDSALLSKEERGGKVFFQYAPREAELGQMIDALAIQFTTRRVSVINLLYEAKSVDPIQKFSAAFKVRKD